MKLYNSDQVVIGQVLTAHGVSGLVRVYPHTDFMDRIHQLETVDLSSEAGRCSMKLESASLHGRYWLIKFAGINSREEAAKLSGSLMVIPFKDRIPLPEGSYYHDQLVGLDVYDTEGVLLGLIVKVLPTGGHDLYLMEQAGRDNRQTMIPAVRKFVRQVDLNNGFMVVKLPEGLLDI